jgi:hypothetical protein
MRCRKTTVLDKPREQGIGNARRDGAIGVGEYFA